MKKFLALSMLLSSLASFATVDGNSELYILVKDFNSEEYFVQKAPIIGCWGLPKGPELMQLTRSYRVSNIGCGSHTSENINALTCAKVLESEESADFSTFSKIKLDISKCADKNSPDFIKNVEKVVKLNFATKKVKKINLLLVK
jgi:hypothetical protein